MPDSLNALGSHKCSAFRHPNTGRVVPWHVKIGDALVDHHVVPAFCTNDEELELRAVLSGMFIGQLTSVTAAGHIRSGRLIPLLTDHVADHASFFLYYGSRAAQPVRARAFIDLALERLIDSSEFVLSEKELTTAQHRGHKFVKRQ
jgi:DNA-binding transcriptional LysR family regulator